MINDGSECLPQHRDSFAVKSPVSMGFKSHHALFVCLVLSGMAWASSASADVTFETAQNTVAGTFKGSTTCGTKIGTQFKFTELTQTKNGYQLKGSYETFDISGGHGAPHQQTPLVATLDSATGLLQIQSTLPPPKDPNACPAGMGTLFGHKMECKGNFLGSIGEKIAANRAQEEAKLLMASKFRAALARDDDGGGWHGTIVNPAFDCPVLSLRHEGADSQALPPVTPEANYTQSNYFSKTDPKGPESSSRLYWLKLAAKGGHLDGNAFSGLAYDAGEGTTPDPAVAANYYRVAADMGDARSQHALSQLYAACRGVPCDPAESKRLEELSRATRLAATRVCTSPVALAEFQRLMLASMNDPTNQAAQLIVGAFTGVLLDPGSFRIVTVEEQVVSRLDRPFICQVSAKRIGTTLTNIEPDFAIVDETRDHDLIVRDQRFEAAMNRAMAAGVTNLMNAIPWIQGFRIVPQGGNRYRLVMQQEMIALSREYASSIDTGQLPPDER